MTLWSFRPNFVAWLPKCESPLCSTFCAFSACSTYFVELFRFLSKWSGKCGSVPLFVLKMWSSSTFCPYCSTLCRSSWILPNFNASKLFNLFNLFQEKNELYSLTFLFWFWLFGVHTIYNIHIPMHFRFGFYLGFLSLHTCIHDCELFYVRGLYAATYEALSSCCLHENSKLRNVKLQKISDHHFARSSLW
jgi:hypothetical protein